MSNKSLKDQIRDFQRHKKKLIPTLIALGILGLFLPILPGIAFLFLGFLLLFPGYSEELIRKIRQTTGI